MKFYLCQTAAGPKYARTQAEAKALDPRFELVNYDTDQAALVDRFNALLAQGRSLVHADDTAIITGDTASALTPEMADKIRDAERPSAPAGRPPEGVRGQKLATLPDGSCALCHVRPAGSRTLAESFTLSDITEGVFALTKPALLDRVTEAVDEQRAILARG